MYNCILITGASSGIGQSLAEYYAAPKITLIITGRDKERLQGVQKTCEAKGATVVAKVIDVTDQAAMEAWLHKIDEKHPVDLLIANAGVRANGSDPDRAEYDKVLKTNLDGVLNTVWPIMQRMKERKAGHIAVTSSLASYRGYPKRGAYCASKAAVKMLCECWRLELEPYNIAVSTICPGFVKTRLTAGAADLPLIMETEESAKRIAKGLAKKKAVIAYPLPVFLLVRLLQCLPVVVSDFFVRMAFKKRA